MRTSKIVVLAAVLAPCLMAAVARAGTVYTEGFEGSGYDFYSDPGSSAGISTTQFHSGLQSAQFTLDATHFAYTRWKSVDISAYGWTLGDITASDWVMRTLGRSDLAPYFLFTIATPDTTQETLAIQFSLPAIADNTWTQNNVDGTTLFHVVGDRTGLGATQYSSSNGGGLLSALRAETYSGSTTWGSFLVTRVRVGAGLWDASQTWNGYVDDVTIGSAAATAVPLPTAMWSGLALLAGLGGFAWLRRRRGADSFLS